MHTDPTTPEALEHYRKPHSAAWETVRWFLEGFVVTLAALVFLAGLLAAIL